MLCGSLGCEQLSGFVTVRYSILDWCMHASLGGLGLTEELGQSGSSGHMFRPVSGVDRRIGQSGSSRHMSRPVSGVDQEDQDGLDLPDTCLGLSLTLVLRVTQEIPRTFRTTVGNLGHVLMLP